MTFNYGSCPCHPLFFCLYKLSNALDWCPSIVSQEYPVLTVSITLCQPGSLADQLTWPLILIIVPPPPDSSVYHLVSVTLGSYHFHCHPGSWFSHGITYHQHRPFDCSHHGTSQQCWCSSLQFLLYHFSRCPSAARLLPSAEHSQWGGFSSLT